MKRCDQLERMLRIVVGSHEIEKTARRILDKDDKSAGRSPKFVKVILRNRIQSAKAEEEKIKEIFKDYSKQIMKDLEPKKGEAELMAEFDSNEAKYKNFPTSPASTRR